MAGKRAQAKRTVSFFRLVAADKDGHPVQLDGLDWQTVLDRVRQLTLLQRTYQGPDRRLIAEVLQVDGDLALKLMEPRDEESWLEILRQDQAAAPIEAVGGELVETTVAAFFDRNIFGIIRGSTSSPSHTAIAEWLDHLELAGARLLAGGSHVLRAEPAMSQRQRQLLNQSSGVSKATVRISTSKAQQLQDAGSSLGGLVQELRQTYGEILVTVTLQIPRGKANDQARADLKQEAEKLRSVAGDAESVSATLVHYDAEARARSEEVDFIHQRIAISRGVDLRDERGESIRNASAVRAIISAAVEAGADLATA